MAFSQWDRIGVKGTMRNIVESIKTLSQNLLSIQRSLFPWPK